MLSVLGLVSGVCLFIVVSGGGVVSVYSSDSLARLACWHSCRRSPVRCIWRCGVSMYIILVGNVPVPAWRICRWVMLFSSFPPFVYHVIGIV